jgi:Tfp pilus assembly protein PilZ
MPDALQLAKAAREQLAAALNALQTTDVPEALEEAAEPIAAAMSVLHRIERSGGADLDGRQDALVSIRTALDRLQKVDGEHPAVEIVMEAVAASLSNVHALVRLPAPEPAAQPRPQAPIAQRLPAPPPAAPQPEPPRPKQPPREGIGSTMPSAQPITPAYAPPPVAVAVEAPRAPTPAPAPPAPAFAAPAPAPAPAARPAAQPAAVPPARASQPQGTPSVDVELGTHSTSNFYNGLGGNDVIEHGGIFVATYKVLKIGSPVSLRVLLPGNYEFTASGVVQWTREGSGVDPGFGARFTQISQEGRQLVYRYTRNREPMVYDDL